MRSISLALILIACSVTPPPCGAEPWLTDFAAEAPGLPWLYEGVLMTVDEAVTTFLVVETFRGDALPGDTVSAGYWEMGTYLWTALKPGDRLLLVPDSLGRLQMTGTRGDGYWMLRGFYDCNGFIVSPGVITTEGLTLLLEGEDLPPETAVIDIRFPGSDDCLQFTIRQTPDGWSAHSDEALIGGLELEVWDLALGGGISSALEPPVHLSLGAEGGMTVELMGRIDGFREGVYRCTVWPAAPVLTSACDLAMQLSGEGAPGVRELPVELGRLLPEELGLAGEPSLTIDEHGSLVLSGANGPLPIYVIQADPVGAGPVLGFGLTGAEDRMVYMDFGTLPEGPSGHLVTDIVDALQKGPISGAIWAEGMQDSGTFTLGSLQ
jgi:hypothetical protein